MADFSESHLDDVLKEVKELNFMEEVSDYDKGLKRLIPRAVGDAEAFCHREFEANDLPSAVVLYLAEMVQHKVRDEGIKSEKLGNATVTYLTPEEASQSTYKRLRKLRQLPW